MKVQILSDLHLEFFRGDLKGRGTVSIHPDAEVVVLAGDIHLGKQSLEFAAELHARCARPVLWVPGNHEYYGQDHEKLSQGFSRSHKQSGCFGWRPFLWRNPVDRFSAVCPSAPPARAGSRAGRC